MRAPRTDDRGEVEMPDVLRACGRNNQSNNHELFNMLSKTDG